MRLILGIDVGVVTVKIAGVAGMDLKSHLAQLEGVKWIDEFFLLPPQRSGGAPVFQAEELVRKIEACLPPRLDIFMAVTGSAAAAFCARHRVRKVNEFSAVAAAVNRLYPEVRTIFEMGGESSKFILLDRENASILDYGVNGDCAAGTGSFIDQQASRLSYKVEDIGDVIASANRAAHIAGRCSVFAKSDMIHAQQKGYTPPEVLKGLCIAVARNFRATIVREKTFARPVAFIGGVALNRGVVDALREEFSLSEAELMVPEESQHMGAIGAAMMASQGACLPTESKALRVMQDVGDRIEKLPTCQPLARDGVVFLRDMAGLVVPEPNTMVDVYIGIDVGSVSTNLVVLNKRGEVLKSIYTKTRARPIEVVTDALKEVERELAGCIRVLGVGATGSGRELIGELVGADVVIDEITCHKTGAVHIADTLMHGVVDTIFEIGGQDSKFIRIRDGIVVDFAMNEACAAGTGSFLEEQAEKLGISIRDEFARLALSSSAPINMGERCTVFMERDVNAYLSRGASLEDITAGLAYSVVHNYLNRVVRGRDIGRHIFFQGGTAYNDAVACAFARVLNRTIIVPPYNGVIGAIGAALMAKNYVEKNSARTTFRGFDLARVKYSIREFECKGCSNRCHVQEFSVDRERTYWGDKCSERYRKKTRCSNKPVVEDLIKLRERLLFEEYHSLPDPKGAIVGVPRCMYFYDKFPFWRTYFTAIDCRLKLSPPSNSAIVQMGLASTVTEPCFPIKVAHGHIRWLLEEGKLDYVWVPNIVSAERSQSDERIPYLCPWGMTLPFVVKVASFAEAAQDKILSPTLQFFFGREYIEKSLWPVAKKLGASRAQNKRAVQLAFVAQLMFNTALQVNGKKALRLVESAGQSAIVLVGRPYNLFDAGANLGIPSTLRKGYGMNVIPFDMLPIDDIDIRDVADNVYWNYGRKILAAVRFTASHSHLHVIYVTNFKCGPDSFIKHYAHECAGKPFLVLQLDEHANDAGLVTRIEAYLESKCLVERCNLVQSA